MTKQVSHGRLWTGIDGMAVILDLIQNLQGRAPDTDTQDWCGVMPLPDADAIQF